MPLLKYECNEVPEVLGNTLKDFDWDFRNETILFMQVAEIRRGPRNRVYYIYMGEIYPGETQKFTFEISTVNAKSWNEGSLLTTMEEVEQCACRVLKYYQQEKQHHLQSVGQDSFNPAALTTLDMLIDMFTQFIRNWRSKMAGEEVPGLFTSMPWHLLQPN